jgi:hypothetical protein
MHCLAKAWPKNVTDFQHSLVGGLNPSEKYDFVSWDDEIRKIWNDKIQVPNHQPPKKMVECFGYPGTPGKFCRE